MAVVSFSVSSFVAGVDFRVAAVVFSFQTGHWLEKAAWGPWQLAQHVSSAVQLASLCGAAQRGHFVGFWQLWED